MQQRRNENPSIKKLLNFILVLILISFSSLKLVQGKYLLTGGSTNQIAHKYNNLNCTKCIDTLLINLHKLNGYYESHDSVNKTIDILIFKDMKFERYTIKNGVTRIGTGNYNINFSKLTLNYDSLPSKRYFKVLCTETPPSPTKLKLRYKIDTSDYEGLFGSYKIFLLESGKQKLDITKGYKTKRADTLISPVALIVTSDFKREIPIAKDCSIQDCSLIFNNTNETVYNKGVFNYEIIEVKGNILKIKCGKNTVVYYKDETMAIKFKEWIELKNRVHLYY